VTLLLCTLLAVQPRFLGPPEKNPDAGTARAVRVGEAAPRLAGDLETSPATGARTFDLTAIVGAAATDPARAVLVAFYAPWCAGCADELRVVRQLASEYRARGLRAIVVDLGAGDGGPAALRALLEDQGAGILVVRDRWQINARHWLGGDAQPPALFVVGREGNVRASAMACGADAVAALRPGIDEALAH
jgi:thiol-disulfide isomerase/thioredoxin